MNHFFLKKNIKLLIITFLFIFINQTEAYFLSFSNITAKTLTVGLRNYCVVKIYEDSGILATNFYGSVILSSSSYDTIFSSKEILIIKGISQQFWIKEAGNVSKISLSIKEPVYNLSLNTNIVVIDPEEINLRQTLIVNELMVTTDNDNLFEWIEFYNNSYSTFNLTNICIYIYDQRSTSSSYFFKITPSTEIIPEGLLEVPPYGFLLLVRAIPFFKTVYPEVITKTILKEPPYEKTKIIACNYTTDKFKLSSSGSTVYVAENNSLNSKIFSLFIYRGLNFSENISLERKSVNIPVQDKNNWSFCPVYGGTPGRTNYLTLQTEIPYPLTKDRIINLQSRIVKEELYMLLKSNFSIFDASLSIISTSGKLIKILKEKFDLLKEENMSVSVILKDSEGYDLISGIYFVLLEGKDYNGKLFRQSEYFIIMDKK